MPSVSHNTHAQIYDNTNLFKSTPLIIGLEVCLISVHDGIDSANILPIMIRVFSYISSLTIRGILIKECTKRNLFLNG